MLPFLSITSAISAFSGSSALKIGLRILLRAKLTVKSRLLAYSWASILFCIISSFIHIYFDNLVSSTSYVIIFMSISITY
jgi:uncharacterized membrane protein